MVRGWVGSYRSSFLFSILFGFSISLGAAAASKPCGDVVLDSIRAFDDEWHADFSRYPGLKPRLELVRARLLEQKELNPDVRAWLEGAEHPLVLGDRHAYRALELAYLRFIDGAALDGAKKAHLTLALRSAVEALTAKIPQFRDYSAGDMPEPEPTPELVDSIYQEIRQEGTRRCIARTAILFMASNTINTAGALQAKWKEYAGPDAGLVEGVMEKATWDKALADGEFRHNMTWNAIMMTSLGALSCLKNKNLGRNLVSGLAAACSVTGQYLSTGKVTVSQTVMDVLFVRFISMNKSAFTFRMAEGYSRSGLPAPLLVETGMQLVSEGVGSYLYPRAVTLNKWLWSVGAED